MEALSPMKRSNSIAEGTFETQNNRYNQFARNYQKTENSLSKSYNTGTLRKGLSKAGSLVMKGSKHNNYQKMNRDEYPKMNSSHSIVPEYKTNKADLNLGRNLKAPNSTKVNPSPYNDIK